MSGGSLLIVRAEVAAPADRPLFDDWYRNEHLPQAGTAFQAKRAWRCWSKLDPSVHYDTAWSEELDHARPSRQERTGS